MNLLAFLSDSSPEFSPLQSGGTVEDHIQFVYTWVFWTSVVVGVAVSVALLYAFVRFRRRSDDEEPVQVHGSTKLEIAWTLTPFAILITLFVISALNMEYIRQAPVSATGKQPIQITVVGQQFSWTYWYTGQTNKEAQTISTATTLYVPANTPVELHIVSSDSAVPDPKNPKTNSVPSGCATTPYGNDAPSRALDAAIRQSTQPDALKLATAISDQGCGVNHSFYVPSLMGQVNAIPGQVNYLWFDARPGDYLGQCTELCGVGHANMLIEVKALDANDYAQWLNQQVSK